MWEIWGKNSQSFDVWRTLTPTGVKGCRNRVTCRSQVMRPQGPLMPCTSQMLSSKYCQRQPIETWKMSNFGVWMRGALPPMSPVNPYLAGNAWKKWATFYLSVHLCTLWKPHFGAKYGPRGPSRDIYEPGGPGCRRDTYCIERVKHWYKT